MHIDLEEIKRIKNSDYSMYNCVCIFLFTEVVVSKHNLTSKEFEDVTKEWFRQGGQRLMRDKKKNVGRTASLKYHNITFILI